jgi:YD repeat-containing protein
MPRGEHRRTITAARERGQAAPVCVGHTFQPLRRLVCAAMLCVLAAGVAPSADADVPLGVAESEESALRPSFAAGVWVDGGVVDHASAELRRISPEAVLAREQSRTAYRGHLSPAAAARIAAAAYPTIVDRVASGSLQLPSGTKLARYLSDNAASIDLPNGAHAIAESLTPVASPAADHHFTPINLTLQSTDGAYMPLAAAVPVRIPTDLRGGISTPADGIAITPVSASGTALDGAASENGTGVLYADTQTDTDTLAKPTSVGFELDELLRSPASPGRFYYRVSLPPGARLTQLQRGSKPVAITGPDGVLAMIPAPEARDAAGTNVPVTMTVSGSTVAVTLPSGGDYQYPLVLDPEVEAIDSEIHEPTHWKFGPTGAPHFIVEGLKDEISYLEIESSGEYKAGEKGYLVYQTQGDSHIFDVSTYLKVQNEGKMEAVYELEHEAEQKEVAEESILVAPAESEVYEKTYFQVCAYHTAKGSCAFEGNYEEYGAAHNMVRLQESATAAGSGYNHANMYEPVVWIAQPKGPENPFVNTTEEKLASDANRRNVMYGSGGWLSQYSGALEVKAKDPGIGVSKLAVKVSGSTWNHKYEYYHEHLCEGVQCKPEVSQVFTYSSELPNGEDKLVMESEDQTVTFSPEVESILKVDNTQPYNLKMSGMAEEGAELSASPHEIAIEATEGKKPTLSSGIKELTATIDGERTQVTQAGHCTTTECTAVAKIIIPANTLGVGVHTLIFTAVSNAGVEARREVTFGVVSSGPVPVGPGKVEPAGGEYALSATDVALTGVGAVRREYGSRSLTAGVDGPLGPQWKVSVGTGDELEILGNGTAVLAQNSGSGSLTAFRPKEGGEYEAPKGDSNLKLEYEPKEHIYLFKDPTEGTTLKFAQPEGEQEVSPSPGIQFGTLGSEHEQFIAPKEVAVDRNGNIWVTDSGNDRVEKFNIDGESTTSYGSAGSGNGQYSEPVGIAINQASGNVYVGDRGNGRVEELNSSGEFVRAFGSAGSGADQLSGATGITIDPHENVWVADSSNNRLDEFSSTGSFTKALGWGVSNGEAKLETCTTSCKAGLSGSGAGEFDLPHAIAFSAGKMFVDDLYNNRADVFSEAGEYQKAFGSAGTGNGQFDDPDSIATEPVSGDLYVTDWGNDRVEVFTTEGTFQTTFGTKGAGPAEFNEPRGLAFSANGTEYYVDSGNNRVVNWIRPTWLGTIAENPDLTTSQTFSYRTISIEGKPVIEPVEELGPKPSGVKCSVEPAKSEKGCRELTFKYATSTTATGENPSEWGEYKGRLVEVLFTAYNPATKGMMVETPVAQYSYDKQGRLRAEWDPRVPGKALKTTYGYDSEGHVTSLQAPGQQPWLFHYGELAGDTESGRLLSVIRPSAATSLTSSEAPKNTAVPALSSSKPQVGTKITISANGTWSNSPLTYQYQWESCSASGKECAPIAGAVNESYYPATAEVGKTLVGEVIAYNSTGAVSVATTATEAVKSGTYQNPAPEPPSAGKTSIMTIDYEVPLSGSGAPHEMTAAKVAEWGQTDAPFEATAVFPPSEPMGWPAKVYTRARIEYRDSKGRAVNASAPNGAISTSEYNSENELVRTLSASNRAAALGEGCKSVEHKECKAAEVAAKLSSEKEYAEEGTELVKVTGPEHKVKLSGGEEVEARAVTRYDYNEGAKEVEEKTHEQYKLVTKTTSGALLASGEEKEVRTTSTSYSGEGDLGWKLRAPTSTTDNPGGLNLVHTVVYEASTGAVVETKSPMGTARQPSFWQNIGDELNSEPGHLILPWGVARDAHGNIWVTDFSGTYGIDEYSPTYGTFIRRFGEEGSGNGQVNGADGIAVSNGEVFVADGNNNRVEIFTEAGVYANKFGSEGTAGGQFKGPAGIALDSSGDRWVVDYGNNRIQEFNAKNEFVEAVGFGVSNGEAKLEICTSACKAGIAGSGEGQFNKPEALAIAPSGKIYVTDRGNDRVEVFSATGSFLSTFGKDGSGSGEFSQPNGVAVASNGHVYVADSNNSRVEIFGPSNEYLESFGTNGSREGDFEFLSGLAVSPEGHVYVADFGTKSQVEDWLIEPTDAGAHDTRMINYTAAANSEFAECGNHPEWAGLTCETRPTAQPETKGLPELPVDEAAYNVWDAPETVTEHYGSIIRTHKKTYDADGRETSSEVTSTIDKTLPKVSFEYNESTGTLEKQSASGGGTLTSKYNSLGQLVEYDDSTGNVTKYTYEEGGADRLTEVSDGKGSEAAASQTYSYNSLTGAREKLVDSAAGTFTATYNLEGGLESVVYPDGLTEKYAHDATGQAVGLEYVKTTDCTEKCTWYSDTDVPGIFGEVRKQNSTLAEYPNYSYDAIGRLTEVQEIPTGKGCIQRIYGYDEDSNRTSLLTRQPGYENKCGPGGESTYEGHTYDPGDRLDDPGVAYETFGNTTTLPAADAGGGEITTSYYVDNQVAAQTQNGETFKYNYDPAGRTSETEAEGTSKATTISHYSGPGETVVWRNEGSETWTRYISGIDGGLDAIEKSSGKPMLQLHNLAGDVVATVGVSETETKLFSTYNSTEFGVPNEGKAPPEFAWLGADGVASELSLSGTVTESGASYVPEVARQLQTFQVIPPGAAPDGTGPGAPYSEGLTKEEILLGNDLAAGAPGREAERQKAKEEEAERRAEAELAAADPKCYLQVETATTTSSTGRQWEAARATGWCHGELLPRGSLITACLYYALPAGDVGAEAAEENRICGPQELSGINSKAEYVALSGELYSHVHTPCEGDELSYWAWGYFWGDGKYGKLNAPHTKVGKVEHCGEGSEGTVEEFVWAIAEILPEVAKINDSGEPDDGE